MSASGQGTPVIYDTDIGTDIDDTWALALILASPELDLRLVVTDSGDTLDRARLAAKLLAECGAGRVPIGIGVPGDPIPNHQAPWFEGYSLDDYPGTVHEDGVQALIDVILASDEQTTVIAVGPVPNIEEALRREPRIASKARVVAMSGSVDLGYSGSDTPHAEYNVRAAASATRAMYEAPWDVLIAPLDTAGQVRVKGDLYRRLRESKSKCVEVLLENYRVWSQGATWASYDSEVESSVLYDALAVAMVYRPQLVEIEEVRLEVTVDGFTKRSPRGAPVRAALRWRQERSVFEELLVERLLALD